MEMNLYPFFLYFLTDVGELQHKCLDFRNVNFMKIDAMIPYLSVDANEVFQFFL